MVLSFNNSGGTLYATILPIIIMMEYPLILMLILPLNHNQRFNTDCHFLNLWPVFSYYFKNHSGSCVQPWGTCICLGEVVGGGPNSLALAVDPWWPSPFSLFRYLRTKEQPFGRGTVCLLWHVGSFKTTISTLRRTGPHLPTTCVYYLRWPDEVLPIKFSENIYFFFKDVLCKALKTWKVDCTSLVFQFLVPYVTSMNIHINGELTVKNKIPFSGSSIPVLGMKLKRG